MATPGRGVRSTRKLRQWTVEQVESGKFRGLVWDDPPAKTMFRIPWKHAGKQEFRQDEDAAFFKAWAILKGKYRPGERFDCAACKTRIRCALSKSPEFEEVPSRSRLDITEPYKVYRLVPLSEQRNGNLPKKSRKAKLGGSNETSEKSKKPRRDTPVMPLSISLLDMNGNTTSEVTASPLNAAAAVTGHQEDVILQLGEPARDVTEIALHYTVPADVLPLRREEFSVQMSIFYSGVLVHCVLLPQGDFLISSVTTPPGVPSNRMARVVLPSPDKLEDPEKQQATLQLLKDLEKGVMVDSNREGIFIQRQRKCKANIFWRGLTASENTGKLDSSFLQVFSTKAFQSAWNQYQLGLTPKPEHQVTLCIGEEVEENASLNNKLIIIQMTQKVASRMTGVKEVSDSECFSSPFPLTHPST